MATVKELAASLEKTNNKLDKLADTMSQLASDKTATRLPGHIPAVLPVQGPPEGMWRITYHTPEGVECVGNLEAADNYSAAERFDGLTNGVNTIKCVEVLTTAMIAKGEQGEDLDEPATGPHKTMEEYHNLVNPPTTGGTPVVESPPFKGGDSPRLSIDTAKRREEFDIEVDGETVKKKKWVYMKRENRDLVYATAVRELPTLRLAVLDASGNPTDQVIELDARRTSWGKGQGNVLYGSSDNTPLIEIGDGRHYRLSGGVWLTVIERLT